MRQLNNTLFAIANIKNPPKGSNAAVTAAIGGDAAYTPYKQLNNLYCANATSDDNSTSDGNSTATSTNATATTAYWSSILTSSSAANQSLASDVLSSNSSCLYCSLDGSLDLAPLMAVISALVLLLLLSDILWRIYQSFALLYTFYIFLLEPHTTLPPVDTRGDKSTPLSKQRSSNPSGI
jgi:hypothetical protein